MGTGQRTRSILLATEFSTSVDRLTWLTWLTASPRLTGFNRSLSTTQWLTFTVAVTIPFIRQDPFNFNVEISVSCNLCRYQDPAGFRPRAEENAQGPQQFFDRLPLDRCAFDSLAVVCLDLIVSAEGMSWDGMIGTTYFLMAI